MPTISKIMTPWLSRPGVMLTRDPVNAVRARCPEICTMRITETVGSRSGDWTEPRMSRLTVEPALKPSTWIGAMLGGPSLSTVTLTADGAACVPVAVTRSVPVAPGTALPPRAGR